MTTTAGIPLSLATGLRFALKSGRGTQAAPVRSAILGAVLAIVVLVYDRDLRRQPRQPRLASIAVRVELELRAPFGIRRSEDLPAPQITALLDHDHYIKSWSGANFVQGQVNGQSIEVMTENPGSRVGRPILSGHGLEAPNQIVMGDATLAALHKRIGDTVTFSDGKSKGVTLTIAGTATLTPITKGLDMGDGAVVATSDIPTSLLNAQDSLIPGPQAILIRFRSDADRPAALRSVHAIIYKVNRIHNDGASAGGLVSHLRPAEIENYRSMGTTPAILGGGLALGAVVALALTLVASVRRRRRELALLKTLGFVRRQLAAAVAWQSSIAVPSAS